MKDKEFIHEIKVYLKDILEPGRYAHTIRTGEYARDLAKHHGVDPDKAYLAGTLHDLAKKREVELLEKYDISDCITMEDLGLYKSILHSPLGACEAKDKFSIEDEDILNAICYHTTGRPGMSPLEKIVYLADSLEPKRPGDLAKKLRKIAKHDLNKAMIMNMDAGLTACIEKGKHIHPLTIDARNYYLQKGVEFE